MFFAVSWSTTLADEAGWTALAGTDGAEVEAVEGETPGLGGVPLGAAWAEPAGEGSGA